MGLRNLLKLAKLDMDISLGITVIWKTIYKENQQRSLQFTTFDFARLVQLTCKCRKKVNLN